MRKIHNSHCNNLTTKEAEETWANSKTGRISLAKITEIIKTNAGHQDKQTASSTMTPTQTTWTWMRAPKNTATLT